MRRQLLTTAMVAISFIAFCQSDNEEVDLVQSMFGMEKKAVAADFMQLDDAQKDAFWITYDEYETKRKALGKKRLELFNRYVTNYTSLDDTSMDQIINDMTSLQTKTDKLISDYYKKMKKQSGVKAAAQFYQFEHYILSNIRTQILETVPLIGELEKK